MKPTLRRSRSLRRTAFTLIELLLVLVILAILAAAVVVKFAGRSEDARKTTAKTDIATLGTALGMFETDNGRFPRSEEGLQALIVPPADAKDPAKWPYLTKPLSPDPWGHPYQYRSPGEKNPIGYDLYSMGADGREGGDDDITNWQP